MTTAHPSDALPMPDLDGSRQMPEIIAAVRREAWDAAIASMARTEFCWLVELRGVALTKPWYHTGFKTTLGESRATDDPHKAKRYATKAAAVAVAFDLGCDLAGRWEAIEHGFEVAQPSAQALKDAERDVLAERRRQVEAEGWNAEHDDEHAHGEIARAALCYVDAAAWQSRGLNPLTGQSPAEWPWHVSWWKPKDRRRNLVKAGALILAEIERLDRAASAKEPT